MSTTDRGHLHSAPHILWLSPLSPLTLIFLEISTTDRGHLHSALHTVGLSPLEPLTHRLPGISTTDRGGEAASSPSPQLVASP